jgi:hypothetical protein
MFWQRKWQAPASSESDSTGVDYCLIFRNKMGQLYWLAYVLTADQEKAMECYVSGLECCLHSTGIFREWADSWTRRMIIKNAIRSMAPCESDQVASDDHPTAPKLFRDWPTSLLLKLNAFGRFVFVMSVLERYSLQECAVLLGCCPRQVADARAKALHHMGSTPRRKCEQASAGDRYGFTQLSTKEEEEAYEE